MDYIYILILIATSLISILLSDKIIYISIKIAVLLGLYTKVDLTGKWKATFILTNGKIKTPYMEIIYIKNRFGKITGTIVPDGRNYTALHPIMNYCPDRVKGKIVDDKFFVGEWYNPLDAKREPGYFELSIDKELERLEGQWIGYSQKQELVSHGIWYWEKMK